MRYGSKLTMIGLAISLGGTACSDDVMQAIVEQRVSFSNTDYSTSESTGAIRVEVKLDRPAARDVKVNVKVIGGSATAGEDFKVDESVEFTKGSDTSSFLVDPIVDESVEIEERIVLALEGTDDVVVIQPSSVSVVLEGEKEDVPPTPGCRTTEIIVNEAISTKTVRSVPTTKVDTTGIKYARGTSYTEWQQVAAPTTQHQEFLAMRQPATVCGNDAPQVQAKGYAADDLLADGSITETCNKDTTKPCNAKITLAPGWPRYAATGAEANADCSARGMRMCELSELEAYLPASSNPVEPMTDRRQFLAVGMLARPNWPQDEQGAHYFVGQKACTTVDPNTNVITTSWLIGCVDTEFSNLCKLQCEEDVVGQFPPRAYYCCR